MTDIIEVWDGVGLRTLFRSKSESLPKKYPPTYYITKSNDCQHYLWTAYPNRKLYGITGQLTSQGVDSRPESVYDPIISRKTARIGFGRSLQHGRSRVSRRPADHQPCSNPQLNADPDQ